MATVTHQGALLISTLLFTCLPESFATSCRVLPSDYAYKYAGSITTTERISANCRKYQSGLVSFVSTERYIHCDGTQLKLADSDLGSVQYDCSDYYVWPAGTSNSQLLFIFQTRVNLTTTTLHYYSDCARGLPRLRFFAVPDDYDIWNAPSASYRYVEVAAIPPDGELAGRRNISITFNFNTARVLMYKFRSDFQFDVSEVEFFTCIEVAQIATTTMPMTRISSALPTIEPSTSRSTSGHDAIEPLQTTDPIMDSNCLLHVHNIANTSFTACSVREVIPWTLAAVLAVLFVGLLTINVIMLWIYKKRQSKDNNVETAVCEMEGNPSNEASNLKKTADTEGLQETHVCERVKQN